ncbi:MAG: hypothetical protein ACKOEY_00990, partial [Phenylobacterium sp.]
MKIVKWATLLCVSLLAACSSGDAGGGEPVSQGPVVAASEFRRAVAGHRVTEVKVPGADGARLSTYVYLPAQGAGPVPTRAGPRLRSAARQDDRLSGPGSPASPLARTEG